MREKKTWRNFLLSETPSSEILENFKIGRLDSPSFHAPLFLFLTIVQLPLAFHSYLDMISIHLCLGGFFFYRTVQNNFLHI